MKTTEITFNGPTHHVQRDDAVLHNNRTYVPTRDDTKWVHDWDAFKTAGGGIHFNYDQTEIVLTLPEGFKFSTRFQHTQS